MKKTVLVLIMGLLHIAAVNLYAAGDLVVDGQVGIGDVSPNPRRTINLSQSWDESLTVYSGLFKATNSGTGNIFGLHTKGISTHSSGTRKWVFGTYAIARQHGTGRIENLEGIHAMTSGNSDGTGVVDFNTPLDIMGNIGNAATTTARGIYIRNFGIKANGSVINTYGIYMDEQTIGTNNYQIYSEGGKSYLGGSLGIGTETPNYPLEMGSGAHVTVGGVWTNASSREYKENIRDLTIEEAKTALEKLEPTKFNYKVDKEEEYIGFIAEDVPGLVASKDRKGLSPMDIVAVLTKVVKEQQKVIEELKAEVKQLKTKGLVARIQ